jgi:hypothetical protein
MNMWVGARTRADRNKLSKEGALSVRCIVSSPLSAQTLRKIQWWCGRPATV